MSKSLLAAVVLVVALPSGSLAHKHRPGDVVHSLAQAWSKGSASDVAELFAENGSFTHPFALSAQSFVGGQSGVESTFKTLFSGVMAKSTYAVKDDTVRERRVGALYVVEFEATIVGAGKVGSLDHRATMVLEPSKVPAKEPANEVHEQHWAIVVLTLVAPASQFVGGNLPR
jgi:hypothetical protein